MKRYQLTISLKDGNEIRARVSARNKADALRRLFATTGTTKADIAECAIEPIPIETPDSTRFSVAAVPNKQGWYVCADLDNRVKVEWKKGHYNCIQNVSLIDGHTGDELTTATALREIGDYLRAKIKELL